MDPCLERYLSGLAKSTAENRRPLLEGFFKFCGVSTNEAVKFQRQNPTDYRFVDKAYEWIETAGLRFNTMRTRMGMIRGCFIANRAPLPKD